MCEWWVGRRHRLSTRDQMRASAHARAYRDGVPIQPTRLMALAGLLPATGRELRDIRPDLWAGEAGKQRLKRDVRALPAWRDEHGFWRPAPPAPTPSAPPTR